MPKAFTMPQLPPPKATPLPRDWKGIHTSLEAMDKDRRTTTQYLQDYLTNLFFKLGVRFSPISVPSGQSPFTISATNQFIAAAASASADTTINLPQATGSGATIVVKKVDANVHHVNVVAHGSDSIDGAGSVALASQYQLIRLFDSAVGVWLLW